MWEEKNITFIVSLFHKYFFIALFSKICFDTLLGDGDTRMNTINNTINSWPCGVYQVVRGFTLM